MMSCSRDNAVKDSSRASAASVQVFMDEGMIANDKWEIIR